MLKVRYEMATNKITGWCAFAENWDSLIAGEGEDIIWLENYDGVPSMETDFYFLNDVKDAIIVNPNYIKPEPVRDLAAEIDKLKARIETLEKK